MAERDKHLEDLRAVGLRKRQNGSVEPHDSDDLIALSPFTWGCLKLFVWIAAGAFGLLVLYGVIWCATKL